MSSAPRETMTPHHRSETPQRAGHRLRRLAVGVLVAGGVLLGGGALAWSAAGSHPPGDTRELATPQARTPVVWIQAGHVGPREPGYAAQTGAAAGAYGSEIGFTRVLARKVVARLRAAGVNARLTPGKVTPLGARGAVFVSLHYDVPTGRALIGHAVTGGGENYYHGEGFGTPSPTPYADSAPHRRATTVSPAVAARSRELARRLARRYRTAFTPAHGARTTFGGVQTPTSNPRVMHYYGFYRTRAGARVLIECGAGVTDDRFLRRTGLISRVVSAGVLDYLRARRLR